MYGDTQEQVLKDTLEAVKQLAAAGFMLNLHKSQLVQAAAQVLRHLWTLGGFWAPNITKLTALMEKTDGELAQFNWASLYGLLNFYREYVPAFAELVEPLRQLLGQDAHPWMPEAGECIREVAQHVINGTTLAECRPHSGATNGDQSIQSWHSRLTLAATPRQAKDLDARSQLGPLP